MENKNNNNFSNCITQRLNHSNYNIWKKQMESVLLQKVLFHHIEYSNYDEFRAAKYIPSSIKETKYFREKNMIMSIEINTDQTKGKVYSRDDQENQLEALEEKFKENFKSFESDRQKAVEKWNSEEQQLLGIFSGSIEENIWQDCRCLQSSFIIWQRLKRETGQQTASAWLSYLNEFYNSSMKESETLSEYTGRILKYHNNIIEIGDKNIIFTSLQIIGKIVSSIPNINRYQQILQSIHLMDKTKLTIDYIKQVFIEEDMRVSLNPKLSKNINNVNNVNNFKKKDKNKPNNNNNNDNNIIRECSTANCKGTIAADAHPSFTLCPSCYNNFKQNKNKKDQKVSNVVLCLNVKDKECIPAENILYLDSGCTTHITNGNANIINIKNNKTKILGPTGESAYATSKGDIVFNDNIIFKDSLIVPSLQHNLISVSKITSKSNNIHVLFNNDKFQIFQGTIHKEGTVLINGRLDDTGLYALDPTNIDNGAICEAAEAGRSIVPVIDVSKDQSINNIINNNKSNTINTNGIEPKLDVPPALILDGTTASTCLSSSNPSNSPLALNQADIKNKGIERKESKEKEKKAVEKPLPPSSSLFENLYHTLDAGEALPKFSIEFMNSVNSQTSRTLLEWHLALAHISKKKILFLAEKGIIKIKDPEVSLDCLSCQSTKMKRKKFAKAMPPKADNVGEAIHSDVCGKISPPTLFGQQYIVSFIDELSGYIFVHLIKEKSEVFSKFKEVIARVNNQNATTSVKIFISDGGGEYIGESFLSFLKEKGIAHAKTPPNTPQRNGKSERLNKILFDLARAMLKERKLPRHFWGEAVLYAAYILNRMPKSNNDQTRLEMLFNKKPSLEKTLEFGMPVFFHNADPHIKKLHDRAFEGMFLGFFEDDHTYKILDFNSNKLVSTRTISSHPEHILEFEKNDWDQGFPVEDDNNWITQLSDAPQYLKFNNSKDLFNQQLNNNHIVENQQLINLPEKSTNSSPNEINNNNLNNSEIEQEVDSDEESESEDEDIEPPPPFKLFIPLKDQGPVSTSTQKSSNVVQFALSTKEIEKLFNLSEINQTPNTYKQAIFGRNSKEWKESIAAEHKSLLDQKTFEVVDRPIDKKPISSRYVFKIKTDEKGAISKFKTRLVAKGFTQIPGQDFFEVFSPTLRMDSIRFLISTAVQNEMKVHHLDVETAFLNGKLAEEIYLEIPEGFEDFDRKKKVFKLNKSIYGLKQASRVWNDLFSSELINLGLVRSTADPCIFIKYSSSPTTTTTSTTPTQMPIGMIGVFVDDCFVVGGDAQIKEFKEILMKLFKMHDLGPLNFALGIKFNQLPDNSIQMSQALYVDKLLDKFGMRDAKIAKTPLAQKNADKPKREEAVEKLKRKIEDVKMYQQIVGSLIYLSNSTRPDIAYAVSLLARSMHAPTEQDLIDAKRCLRYCKATRNLALNYNDKNQEMIAYSDSSYAEEKDYKSVGGYITLQAGAAITWKSTKQPIIAQSSMEAEYIAMAEAAKEVEWLRKLQAEFRPNQLSKPTTIFEDNQSSIALSKNPIHSNRSKHIAVRYHKIQELVANQIISVEYKPTDQMIADIMTKSLGSILHFRFVECMGLVSL